MRTRTNWLLFTSILASTAYACDPDDTAVVAVEDDEPAGSPELATSDIVAEKVRTVDGRTYRFQKRIDPDGGITGVVLDESGDEIDESGLPRAPRSRISADLRTAVDRSPRGARLDVRVALVDVPDTGPTPAETDTAVVDSSGRARVTRDGVVLTDAAQRAASEALHARIAAQREARLDRNRAALRELGGRGELARQPGMVEALADGRGSVRLSLAAADVDAFLRRHDHLIAGMELESPLAPHLADAMLDTRINPHALDYSGRRGGGIGIYMSEGSCPDPGHITNYHRINANPANVDTSHPRNVSAIVRGVSPESFVYCRSGYTLPTAADLNGYGGNPRIYVETHSWGEVMAGTDYRIRDRDFDDHVYNDAIAHFQSAGNQTVNNPSCHVGSPAKALNLATIGNYNDATDTISASSCHVNSQILNEKPEFSAPGTAITAGGFTMSGTSMAAPHAAAFAADLMSSYSWMQLKPARVKAAMLIGAAKPISGGAGKVGVGGIDFHRAYYNGTSTSWTGDNASFASYDAGDPVPNNGKVDRLVNLDASLTNVRVSLAWLNRGAYTYDHRADVHPIGLDLDLCVFDPAGVQVACSSNYDNPYELVSFDPQVTGNYRVSITRFANRDTAAKLNMAIHIDW